MLYQVPGGEEKRRSHTVSDTRITFLSLGLAVVLGALPFIKASWFDIRWYGALSSTWLNVFTVALAAHLVEANGARALNTARFPTDIRVLQSDWWRTLAAAVIGSVRTTRWQPWMVLTCAVVSDLFASLAWRTPISLPMPGPLSPIRIGLFAGLGACGLAFGTLVAELFFAMHAERGRAWVLLASVLRVALASALAAVVCGGLFVYAGIFTAWPAQAVAAFNAAIALEFALRAVFSWFAPPFAPNDDANLPDSLVAGLLRLHPSPFGRLAAQLHHRYGIDFRQNWVLQSVLRLLPAAIATIGAGAWLLSGVSMLVLDERAVYERFGAPVAVWQPGIHIGLPWPLGKARIIDNGAVHHLVVAGTTTDHTDAAPLISSDAQTPSQSNRLWDVEHQGEASQVIAGASGEQQNFQVVSADVRLDYRVGLSDAAARASLYRTDDASGAVQAIANREVVRYLASHTLDSLLETRLTSMAISIRRAVQTQLDEVTSGIEVVAVVIQSVHPPAGAAAAWHSVQAAQIRAYASVAQAHGRAAEALGDAQERAYTAVARAYAQAADITATARVQQTSFSAEMVAAQTAAPAFLLEYYLRNLQNGLQNAQITVIDTRLVTGNRATIDLRPYGARDAVGAQHIN